MCYSAEVISDWRLYERLGGTLAVDAFAKLFWTRSKAGDWLKVIPKGMRDSFMEPRNAEEKSAKDAALAAYRNVSLILEQEIAEQTERLTKAQAVLASPKPTKKAANDQRIASNKIAAAKEKLDDLGVAAQSDGFDRIWPGHYAPVLIRDPATGERQIVPMRYRCRLPGWTRAKELEKPGTYNARRDKLSTVWRQLFGTNHGVVVASRFYESVSLHRLEHRDLALGERDIPVEIPAKNCSWPASGATPKRRMMNRTSTPSPPLPATRRPRSPLPVTIGASSPSSRRTSMPGSIRCPESSRSSTPSWMTRLVRITSTAWPSSAPTRCAFRSGTHGLAPGASPATAGYQGLGSQVRTGVP